jgi:hypothetical protein
MDDMPKERDRKYLFLQLPRQSNPSPSLVGRGRRLDAGARIRPAGRRCRGIAGDPHRSRITPASESPCFRWLTRFLAVSIVLVTT